MITKIDKQDHGRLSEIFWETAAKPSFGNDSERRRFEEKYFGFYLSHPAAVNFKVEDDQQILGYILSLADEEANLELKRMNPMLQVFNDWYLEYPAHLHINLTASARGKGLGSLLIAKVEETLRERKISGVHLLTAPTARNRSFYERNGYNLVTEKNSTIMLGKKLL